MTSLVWGLLGPGTLAQERRVRTLALGAAVRRFNDLAVPGLGGVWFGKPLFIATLGIQLAEELRAGRLDRGNIETANALEALGCWLEFQRRGWSAEPRLRGVTKLRANDDLSFSTCRRRHFYVSQPMRMSTVQALPALGLVTDTSERFNAFRITDIGRAFVDEACAPFEPVFHQRSVFKHLSGWARGAHDLGQSTARLCEAISPMTPLPLSARSVLRARLVQGGTEDARRRRATLAWVEHVRKSSRGPVGWADRPGDLDATHWRDIVSGAAFFRMRESAMGALNATESSIGLAQAQKLVLARGLPSEVRQCITALREVASEFLTLNHDPSPEQMATRFATECTAKDPAAVLSALVVRDGRVLRLADGVVIPGPAFEGQPMPSMTDAAQVEPEVEVPKGVIEWPDGLSYRIRNLFLLNLDLRGELDSWLGQTAVGVEP